MGECTHPMKGGMYTPNEILTSAYGMELKFKTVIILDRSYRWHKHFVKRVTCNTRTRNRFEINLRGQV